VRNFVGGSAATSRLACRHTLLKPELTPVTRTPMSRRRRRP
jgi:hypothetical protein